MALNRSPEDIPRHIKANNEEELQMLFLAIQQLNGENYNVISVYREKKEVHMWFYANIKTMIDVKAFQRAIK